MAVIHLTSANFEEEVLKSEVPVLVDFWATWCGPCQMLGPVIEEISEDAKDFKVCKIDVDKVPELAQKYRVMSIPALKVFKNGEVANESVGFMPKDDILSLLK